jgi:membrane fusion protein (multidrug efflux system)
MGSTTSGPPRGPDQKNRTAGPEAPPPAGNKQAGRRAFIFLGLAVVAGLLTIAVYLIATRGQVKTDDAQVESDVVPVAAKTAGQVARVMVANNQKVKSGDPILQIDDSDYLWKVTQAQGDLATAKAQLQAAELQQQVVAANAKGGFKSARAGVSGSSVGVSGAQANIQAAQAALDRALTDAKKAGVDLGRMRELYAAGAISHQQLDASQAASDAAEATVTQAKAGLSAAQEQKRAAESGVVEARGRLTQATSVEAQIAAAHAQTELARGRVQAAEAALALAKNQLQYTTVPAPADGVISNVSVHQGQIISVGQPIAELVPSKTYVVANFKETQMGRMRPGDPARIAIDAFPGRTFEGEVESISAGTGARFSMLPADNASGNFVKVVQRVPVRIRWLSSMEDVPLQAGLSVQVTVFVGKGNQSA